jgi:hypothetical protein
VLGIEGSDTLVKRATENALANRTRMPARHWAETGFVARNLFEMTPRMLVADGMADKWLVDPPREGAFALAKALADLHQQELGQVPEGGATDKQGWLPPKRIVYVSCNPATLAPVCWCTRRATVVPQLQPSTCFHTPRTLKALRCLSAPDRGMRRAPGGTQLLPRAAPDGVEAGTPGAADGPAGLAPGAPFGAGSVMMAGM